MDIKLYYNAIAVLNFMIHTFCKKNEGIDLKFSILKLGFDVYALKYLDIYVENLVSFFCILDVITCFLNIVFILY